MADLICPFCQDILNENIEFNQLVYRCCNEICEAEYVNHNDESEDYLIKINDINCCVVNDLTINKSYLYINSQLYHIPIITLSKDKEDIFNKVKNIFLKIIKLQNYV